MDKQVSKIMDPEAIQRALVRMAHEIVEKNKGVKDIALVTDSGTPGISDPGFYLIRLAQENGVSMTVVPGPTALIAALTLSGLSMDRFVFEGFLPAKSAARRKRLERFKDEKRTVILYESPHRILKTLIDIKEILDNPEIVCVREVTKKFEELKKATAGELLEYFTKNKPRGERGIRSTLVVCIDQSSRHFDLSTHGSRQEL